MTGRVVLLLAIVATVVADHSVTKLPLRYTTTSEQSLMGNQKAVYEVLLNCPHITNSRVEICAELPKNWPWDPFHGFVYLNIFNDVRNIDNLTAAINSTGQPHHGEHVPEKCITLNKWPGGDLFLRVDSNNYNPVVYTLGVIVTPPTTARERTVMQVTQPVFERVRHAGPRDGQISLLTPVLTPNKAISFIYDEYKTFELDLCLQPYQSPLEMTTTLLSNQGTFTHFICDALPCLPDSERTICSANTPLPISTCTVELSDKPKAIYVTVHSAEGVLDPNSHKYMSSLSLGASFSMV